MGIQPGRKIHNRLPKPVFHTLEELDRTRDMMLGLPIKKYSRVIPFGYKVSEEDNTILEPIEEIFKDLVQAKEYLKTCSYMEVARWLSEKHNTKLSHMGLYKIMANRQPVDEVLLPIEERQTL